MAKALRGQVDRAPPVEPSANVERHTIGIEDVLKDARECVFLKPDLDASRLIGPQVAAVRAGGCRREVAEAVPHADLPRASEPVLDLFPRNGPLPPGGYKGLRDRLVGAAGVFDDLSRNE